MNICLYGPGQRWAFTERPAAATSAARTATSWQLGTSRIAWEDGALVLDLDERCVPLPRRLRGRVRLEPELGLDAPLALDPDGRHHWWPVAPRARAVVELDQPGLRFEGAGYHDANWGSEPVEAGFARWTWSRAWTDDGAVVLYDTEPRRGPPQQRTLNITAQGLSEPPAAAHAVPLPGTLWGVGRHTRAGSAGGARLVETYEDTPFYTRSLVRQDLAGQSRLAVHESIDLDRFSSGWVQRLLPFRIRKELG